MGSVLALVYSRLFKCTDINNFEEFGPSGSGKIAPLNQIRIVIVGFFQIC